MEVEVDRLASWSSDDHILVAPREHQHEPERQDERRAEGQQHVPHAGSGSSRIVISSSWLQSAARPGQPKHSPRWGSSLGTKRPLEHPRRQRGELRIEPFDVAGLERPPSPAHPGRSRNTYATSTRSRARAQRASAYTSRCVAYRSAQYASRSRPSTGSLL